MFQAEVAKRYQNTFYVQYFFFFENRAVYEIMWNIVVEPDMPQMRIRIMRIS